mmetsp:Transcript_31021/g.70632  ORF Transcript_31021/g.70632 Transcript_31021/m.70632 type:complete len:153 (+) Transcript_31021:231-689(+)
MRAGAMCLGLVAGSQLMDRATVGEGSTRLSEALMAKSTTTTTTTPLVRRRRTTTPRPCVRRRRIHCRSLLEEESMAAVEPVGAEEQCVMWGAVVNGSLPLESFLTMAGEETTVGWTTFGEAMRQLGALSEEERRMEEGRLVEMGRVLAGELC